MSLLFGTEVVLFSPMEGKLTYEGKPAASAKITRLTKWKDDTGETEIFHANENGEFSIPLKKAKVRISPLAEFVVTQRLTVSFNDEEFVIWAMGNGNASIYGELGGKPTDFTCELTDDRERVEVENGLLMTSCKWKSIESHGEE